jgi:hypothetical protein
MKMGSPLPPMPGCIPSPYVFNRNFNLYGAISLLQNKIEKHSLLGFVRNIAYIPLAFLSEL